MRKNLQRAEEKLKQELLKEKAMYRDMFSSSLKSTSGEGRKESSRAGESV